MGLSLPNTTIQQISNFIKKTENANINKKIIIFLKNKKTFVLKLNKLILKKNIEKQ
jgi:hypothetical protein